MNINETQVDLDEKYRWKVRVKKHGGEMPAFAVYYAAVQPTRVLYDNSGVFD